ncbi:MAG: hypothetical protein HY735_25070 [Verrucomicrobia bacterium]|nr:hypothetical protein [Verrucomicrobiota bacterium]
MMNLFSDEMRRNPYPAYERMRDDSPVFHHELFGIWMIFDFEGVKRALMDHDAFSSDLSHVPGSGNPGERALVSKAFTPLVVANLEPRIRKGVSSERGQFLVSATPRGVWNCGLVKTKN